MNEYHQLQQRIINARVRRMLDEITTPSKLEVWLRKNMPPPKPMTRWERFQQRLLAYRERIVLAWRVLRGDDIHEDCY